MNREGDGLPSRWSKTTLGSLVEVLRGVSYKKVDASSISTEGLVPLLRATNIDRVLNFDGLVYVPTHYVNPDQYLRPGDIVIAASSGSSAVVGKAAQLNKEWFGTFGAFCLGLRAVSAMDNRFLAWFLQGTEYRNRTSQLAAGVNINNLRREHIEGIPIPLPPLAEQRRIVAEIEKQFTRLDASVAALKRVQTNLKRYRDQRPQGRLRGKVGPHRGGACPIRGPRLRARRPTLGAHPVRTPRSTGGPGKARAQVQGARRAGPLRIWGVAGRMGVGDGGCST